MFVPPKKKEQMKFLVMQSILQEQNLIQQTLKKNI